MGAPRVATEPDVVGSAGLVLLLGGAPFEEDIIMWWNFVGRSHEEIMAFRVAWESETAQFGRVTGYQGTPQRLPAPPLPSVRLKPRTR